MDESMASLRGRIWSKRLASFAQFVRYLPVHFSRDRIKEQTVSRSKESQFRVTVRIGQLDVDARIHRQRARFFLVPGDVVAVRVRPVTQLPDIEMARERMVGERGFEPPTPWSRTRCSTRLSHSPNLGCRSVSLGRGLALMAP